MASAVLHSGLTADRCVVDRHLDDLLKNELGNMGGPVSEAMRYGVLGPAQRIRPIISVRLARVFDTPVELTLPMATSVELLHCASLMVDDLPCMDDSCTRRNQPAAHVKFGEATAVLAAFGLVALAARTVVDHDFSLLHRDRLLKFQIQLLRTLDCTGLIAGQALDLQLSRDRMNFPSFDISELKTVPLFSLAVTAGSLFAELDRNEQALLNCFGREFGLAFQIADDLLDGEVASREMLDEKLSTLRAVIAPFGKSARDLEEMVDYLDARVCGASLR
jgi:geranylgeranyl pyrophosphate synthase